MTSLGRKQLLTGLACPIQVRKMDIVFSSEIPELMKKSKLLLDNTDPARAQRVGEEDE